MLKRVSLFTAYIMTFICIASAYIGITDEATGENIRLMLGLDMPVTRAMVYAIAIIGGIFLIVAQYFITKVTMIKTINRGSKRVSC